jgi:LacI family transcriptional regulator
MQKPEKVPLEARQRPATVFDVAAQAGVAVGTVSRYLNGLPMRPGNRAAVEDAIKSLRYNRNAVAQAMRTERTNMVALLVPGYDEFFAGMLAHLTRGLAAEGQVLLTHKHEGDPKALGLALEFFQNHRVNAVIAPGVKEVRPQLEALINQGIPIILFNNDVPDLQVDRVFSKDREGAQRAVRHLINLGHKRIAVITGDLRETTAQHRLDGYLDALDEAGLPHNPDFVVGGSWLRRDAEIGMLKLMEQEPRPTAIFTSNYVLAFAVLDNLRERGMVPGREISLASFDDVELFRQITPAVTAVAQPHAAIGDHIAQIVLDHLSGRRPNQPRRVLLECNMILRDTAQPPFEQKS